MAGRAALSLSLLGALALGACDQPRQSPSTPPPPATADQCGADKLGEYLNAIPTSDIMDRIRAAVGHDRIRVIEPGSAVTMDYRPDRLNLDIGEDGRIKRFHCV